MTTDHQLVAEFARNGDEASFAEIVSRHGPLVMGVCRRVLGSCHDAEDAFQATFLVLARDARKIRRRASLSSWLYGVAYRIAMKAAKQKTRRAESYADEPVAASEVPLDQITRRRDERVIDEELAGLPASYRGALVLHYLREQTNAQIAAELGLSVSAVEGRLKRGRVELRRRLVRRGVTLSIFAAVAAATTRQAAAQTSRQLVETTIQTGLEFASGPLQLELASHELANSEMIQMTLHVKQLLTLAATAIVTVGIGFYGLANYVSAQDTTDARRITVPAATAANTGVPVTIRDLAGAAGGAAVAMTPRQEARAKIEAKLNEKIAMEFFDAPLTDVVDYLAQLLEISIVVDWRALEDFGFTRDAGPDLTLNVADITGRSGLHLLLDSIELDYIIENEVLLITTPEAAEAKLDIRVYDVADLKADMDMLIQAITSSVDPDSWEEVGGPGTIVPVRDGEFVISQTERTHERVSDLLSQLRLVGSRRASRN